MINILTRPKTLLREFNEDRQRAIYWQQKVAASEPRKGLTFQRFRDVVRSDRKDKRGDVIMYDSPKTNNKWMLWYRFISRGYGHVPTVKDYQLCYQLTDPYMTAMIPSRLTKDGVERKGMAVFESHVFLRMAQRLKVDMSDRFLVMRNFVEEVAGGLIDIRQPRQGEKNKQVICRLPRSWLRGYIINVGESYIIRFKTFYTDDSLTPYQRHYLKTFAKISDSLSKAEIAEYFTQEHAGYFPQY